MEKLFKDEQITYRKFQNALMVAGQATILFCIWNGIKMISYLTVDDSYIKEFIEPIVGNGLEKWIMAILVVVIALAIDIPCRLHIGMGAVRVAKGGKWRIIDSFLIVVYVILSVWGMYNNRDFRNSPRILEDASAWLLELLSDIIYIVILVAAYWVYKYRKNHDNERMQVQ